MATYTGGSPVTEYNSIDNDQTYAVGFSKVEPFFPPEALNDHLVLLAAFRDLKRRWKSTHQQGGGASAAAPPPYLNGSSRPADPSVAAPLYEEATLAGAADEDTAWTAFLTRALVRFELYVSTVLPPPAMKIGVPNLARAPYQPDEACPIAGAEPLPADLLPPLDVAMIWHTYLLNPARYREDTVRLKSRQALACWAFPLAQLAKCLAPTYNEKGEGRAGRLDTLLAAQTWNQKTGSAFDPLSDSDLGGTMTDEGTHVLCPRAGCARPTYVSYATLSQPAVDPTPAWAAKCETCGQIITSATLCGRRFIDEIDVWAAGGSDRIGFRLRGGILSPQDYASFYYKDPYGVLLHRLIAHQRTLTAGEIGRFMALCPEEGEDRYGIIVRGKQSAEEAFAEAGCDINVMAMTFEDKIIAAAHQYEKKKDDPLTKQDNLDDLATRTELLFSYYVPSGCHPISPASLDLVAATYRQERFTSSLDNLSWLPPSPLVTTLDTTLLSTAMRRYHMFMHLCFATPRVSMLPTLDIDLGWHTHLLMPRYYEDCYQYLGKFVDHCDKIEKSELSKAFERTAEDWKRKYNRPYSQCGCISKGAGIAGKRKELMGGLKARLKGKSKSVAVAPADAVNDRADHPSGHDAIAVLDLTTKQEITEVSGDDEGGHRNAFG